ncbi:hypothetical protein L7F22_021207 [Adiantum nelumboides]|nr:hypothetical protein [Adiantum nelumboides]
MAFNGLLKGSMLAKCSSNWLSKALRLSETFSAKYYAGPASDMSRWLTLTENNSATYSSSGDACVDFFFHVIPDTPSNTIVTRLEQAWKQDPLVALKLVFHLRDLRSKGKSDREGFYTCTSWLHQHHPNTLLANLHLIPRCGYYKDLLELLVREVEGPKACQKHVQKKLSQRPARRRYQVRGRYHQGKNLAARSRRNDERVLLDREVRVAASLERDKKVKEAAAVLSRQKRKDMTLKLQNKLKESPHFADLHDAVADIFAKKLLSDKNALESNNFYGISLAGKWCPSLKSSYDLRTGLCHAIGMHLFNRNQATSASVCNNKRGLEWKKFSCILAYVTKWYFLLISCLTGLYNALATRLYEADENSHALAMADKLRTDFYVPLRRALKIPEVYMSANRWNELPYERLPSVAMTNYAHLFLKHDKDRYSTFLTNVASGNKKVAAGAYFLTKLSRWLFQKNYTSNCSQRGSGSACMAGTPMKVCIALGLLVSELSEEPFKNRICTFSQEPNLHLVKGNTLAERYRFTERMNWEMNTDFQAVFHLLLDEARAANLSKDKMVKRLFVFSDMEFDQASANCWETDYMKITKMYKEADYGNPPDIVFWNLRDSISTPVCANQKGVVLVSGFSKNLLKIFLDESAELVQNEREKMDPKEAMVKALTGEYFEHLKVVD